MFVLCFRHLKKVKLTSTFWRSDGKNAPNADNALALIEFLTSKQAQEIYADANFEYPVAPGSVPNELVKSWGDYVPDDVNLMDLAALRSQALKLIETVDFDK